MSLAQHRHELAPAAGQRKRNDLLRVPAPVHVADYLVRRPAYMFEVLGAHVEGADDATAPGAVVRGLTRPTGRGHGRDGSAVRTGRAVRMPAAADRLPPGGVAYALTARSALPTRVGHVRVR